MLNQEQQNKLAQGLVELMTEARAISGLPEFTASGSYFGTGQSGLSERVKRWIDKARRLGAEVGATDVSVSVGIPFGISIGVGFPVASRASDFGAQK